MSKRKKQGWGAFPVMGAIKTGEVKIVNPNYESKEQLLARLRQEDADAKRNADPIYQHEQVMTKTMLELRKLSSEFWSRPIAEIYADVRQKAEGRRDLSFPVATAEQPFTWDDVQTAGERFLTQTGDATLRQSGYALSEDGQHRLILFGTVQAKYGATMTSGQSWQEAFLHLKDSLHAFADGELDSSRVPRPRPAEAPAPRHNLDELLETVSAESTEGRKKLEEAIADSLVHREWANCWAGFANSIYENFDGYILNNREKQIFYDTFVRRNLSMNRPADYDRVRVALVRSGDLPSHLLYPQERLAAEVEDADLSDRNVRQEFARRTRLIAGRSAETAAVSKDDRAIIAEADGLSADELRTRLQDQDFVARLDSAYTRTGRR
jgi:hypothetical protein